MASRALVLFPVPSIAEKAVTEQYEAQRQGPDAATASSPSMRWAAAGSPGQIARDHVVAAEHPAAVLQGFLAMGAGRFRLAE